jgi:hypothetical protein
MKRLLATAAMIFVSAAAGAQTLDPNGAYLTKPARAQVGQFLAEQFSVSAMTLGFEAADAQLIAQGLRDQSLKLGILGAGSVQTSQGTIRVNDQQYSYIKNIASSATFRPIIERFASVRLMVNPVPPRDYKIVINGEECEPTERDLYRVLPGHVAVRVSRTGKPECNWTGSIAGGKEQVIACSL